MPRCKACGTEAPATARFCSICGAQVAGAPPPPAAASPPAPTPTATPSAPAPTPSAAAPGASSPGLSRGAWAGIAGGAAVLGIAGFLFARSFGLLGAPRASGPATGVLTPPQANPASAPILATPQTDVPKAPVLQTPASEAVPMPEDVIAYLRWLKAYDRSLHELSSSLEAVGISVIPDIYTGLMGQITGDEDAPAPPKGTGVTERLNGITQQLNAKTGEFQQQPPPEACAPLAMRYGEALGTAVRQCAALVGTFEKIAQTFSGEVGDGAQDRQSMLPDLMKELKNGAMSRDADAQVRAANDALDALRDRYTQIPSDIDRGSFQLAPLDSGMDPTRLLSGKLPGM